MAIQTTIFKENEPTNEYKAYSMLWQYFHDEYNLMLLNEHMDEIVSKCDLFKAMKNNLTTSTERPY